MTLLCYYETPILTLLLINHDGFNYASRYAQRPSSVSWQCCWFMAVMEAASHAVISKSVCSP